MLVTMVIQEGCTLKCSAARRFQPVEKSIPPFSMSQSVSIGRLIAVAPKQPRPQAATGRCSRAVDNGGRERVTIRELHYRNCQVIPEVWLHERT